MDTWWTPTPDSTEAILGELRALGTQDRKIFECINLPIHYIVRHGNESARW